MYGRLELAVFYITGGVGGHIGSSTRRNFMDVIKGPAPVNKEIRGFGARRPFVLSSRMCLRPVPVLRTVPQYQSQLCSGSGARITWNTWGECPLLDKAGIVCVCVF